MIQLTKPCTAETFWKDFSRGGRHELIRGEIRTMAPAGFEHGSTGMNLALPLANYGRKKTVVVYRAGEDPETLQEEDSLDGLDVVSGFRVAVKDIFE